MKTIQEKKEYRKNYYLKHRKKFKDIYKNLSLEERESLRIYNKLRMREKRKDPEYIIIQKERYKKWYKKYGRERNDNDREIAKNWQIHHPIEHKAQRKLRRAVKSGKIIKPLFCEVCKDKVKLCGHHKDYSKSLEVIWVCHSCHKKIHYRSINI